ncbi:MAG: FAD-dependent oxidoreductase [Treponema sp.]|jgi:glycerol-3-phosphate dehydrogenase|nr:FAD-dependent oxidoreductase [Treponema sp.]
MSCLDRINKKLRGEFDNRVRAIAADGCIVLEGELDSWDAVVRAGNLAVKIRGKETRRFLKTLQSGGDRPGGVVNTIRFTGAAAAPMEIPDLRDRALEGLKPDVLVIGGGVTGCSIARELTRYELNVLLIEKEHDLAMHASGRNDGMVHPGLDLRKGSWKYYYNSRGNAMYETIARELGVDFERNGQYLCFGSAAVKPLLYVSLLYWKWMGIPGVRVIKKKELRRLEPGLKKDLAAALFFPSAGVVCPFNLTIALGENAVQNGARISLDTTALGMQVREGRIAAVKTNRGTLYPQVVINAAGTFAEDIAVMAGDRFFSIHPRRGTNSILDKKYTQDIVRTIASRLKITEARNAHTKGGGVIKTAHENILVGPDAVETWERENFATAASSIERTFAKFKDTSPGVDRSRIIAYFTGVRAPTYEEDFVVCKGRRTGNLVHAAGIQSPGLTAAPAIAVDAARFAVDLLGAQGRQIGLNGRFNPLRKPIPRPARMEDAERAALIKENPDYGIILCRCEEVSRGEILDSLRRPVPCDTPDGVKRRVRCGGGRCQGGFCGPLIVQIIAGEKDIPLNRVEKSGPGSRILAGETKSGRRGRA